MIDEERGTDGAHSGMRIVDISGEKSELVVDNCRGLADVDILDVEPHPVLWFY